MKEHKSITDILHRMEEIEKELHELRADLILCATPTTAENGSNLDVLQFTLDDLCEAFGKKHQQYAVRLRNALARHGITTLADFLTLTTGQLLDMEGIGPGTLQYANKALKKLGIRW